MRQNGGDDDTDHLLSACAHRDAYLNERTGAHREVEFFVFRGAAAVSSTMLTSTRGRWSAAENYDFGVHCYQEENCQRSVSPSLHFTLTMLARPDESLSMAGDASLIDLLLAITERYALSARSALWCFAPAERDLENSCLNCCDPARSLAETFAETGDGTTFRDGIHIQVQPPGFRAVHKAVEFTKSCLLKCYWSYARAMSASEKLRVLECILQAIMEYTELKAFYDALRYRKDDPLNHDALTAWQVRRIGRSNDDIFSYPRPCTPAYEKAYYSISASMAGSMVKLALKERSLQSGSRRASRLCSFLPIRCSYTGRFLTPAFSRALCNFVKPGRLL